MHFICNEPRTFVAAVTTENGTTPEGGRGEQEKNGTGRAVGELDGRSEVKGDSRVVGMFPGSMGRAA